MDWTSLGKQVIAVGAPTIGAALGGPVGAQIGGVLATILGVEATPETVGGAIATNPGAVQSIEAAPPTDLGAWLSTNAAMAAALAASETGRESFFAWGMAAGLLLAHRVHVALDRGHGPDHQRGDPREPRRHSLRQPRRLLRPVAGDLRRRSHRESDLREGGGMSEPTIDHAERIAALEVRMEILTRSVEDARSDVGKLLDIVQQARGARYALVGVGAVMGGAIAFTIDYVHKLAAVIGTVLR